jgi:hypothetical protein
MKKTGGMAQVVGHLPSKHKALSLNPSAPKEKKRGFHRYSKKLQHKGNVFFFNVRPDGYKSYQENIITFSN